MVMLVWAVCAAKLLLDPTYSLIHVLSMLEEADVPCRYALAVVIMNMLCLHVDASCHALRFIQCCLI